MYYYGGGSGCGCHNYQTPYIYGGGYSNGGNSYAIVLVLFILLVIVLGCRLGN